jgi:Zn-dependent alcohol dehydrogenase
MRLGAEKWIDFKESTDIIKDIQAATGGGPQAAVITAGHVGLSFFYSLLKTPLKCDAFHSLSLSIKP